MTRTHLLAALAAGAVALGTFGAAAPAQAATFTGYNENYLDVGPLVYTIETKAESEATTQVTVGGKATTVNSQWVISESSIESKAAGDYDDDGNPLDENGNEYPSLPEAHVGYWVARYATEQFAAAQDRFFNGSVADVVAFYTGVVNTPEATARAAFAAGDAKAARIAAVKKDTQRAANKAWNYISDFANRRKVDYVHSHKAAIVKTLAKKFSKSKLYRGTIKVKFTSDIIVQMGPTKADRERFLHYTVTGRDANDKVAFAIDMNTHEGGPYGLHKVKY